MARGAITISVDIIGLKELQALVSRSEWYAQPWRTGMTQLASQGGLAAQRSAPVLTGRTQGSVRAKVQNRPFPTWAAVRVGARRKGFPYPRVLEFSRKHGHLGWFLGTLNRLFGQQAELMLNRVGDEIARRWAHA